MTIQKKINSIVISGLLLLNLGATAQKSASQIFQGLQKLNVTGSVLYIAAHPDDENTRLLAWLANEKKVKTAYLSLTRGDGGQNLIGKEQGEALGLLRTQELLAARKTDGAEQFFTRSNDFGYSKNPEETFTFWNRDSILYDVVFTIRKFKPDVIICRFPTTGEGGHGHHTASALLALEAYTAAADPNRFPDQLYVAGAWQCKRIMWNTFNFGTTNTTAENQLKINCGTYNPLLGKSCGEIAAESRSMHKSQGFGSARQRGNSYEYFKLLKGDSAKTDLFDGVAISWERFTGTSDISKMIKDCENNFDLVHPEKSLGELKKIIQALTQLGESDPLLYQWKKIKINEVKELMLDCAGIWLEANSADYSAVPGEITSYSLQMINRSDANFILKNIRLINGNDTAINKPLKKDEVMLVKTHTQINGATPYSEPYWLSHPHNAGHYWYPGTSMAGKPENMSAFKVTFFLEIENLNLEIERNIEFKNVDPVKGEKYRKLEILPAITIQPASKVLLFTKSNKQIFQVTLKAQAPDQKGVLSLTVPNDWKIWLKDSTYNLPKKGDEVTFTFTLQPEENSQVGYINYAALSLDGIKHTKRMNRVEYDHIPPQFFLEESKSKIILVPFKTGKNNIGYINGAGDEVADCLTNAGYHVTILNDEALSKSKLEKYDAIITGVRAFNTNEKLNVYLGKLMTYVSHGGNLIIQYNTNSRVGPLQTGIGPYPFTISRDRVTDENAEVIFKQPNHPALNKPNKITNQDFTGWVQERGIYFATEVDSHYQTLLQMNDKGEKPHDGSLIIVPYGKGNFVYTGLAFFRQLPAGVPGAYRLFSNLISLTPNKK